MVLLINTAGRDRDTLQIRRVKKISKTKPRVATLEIELDDVEGELSYWRPIKVPEPYPLPMTTLQLDAATTGNWPARLLADRKLLVQYASGASTEHKGLALAINTKVGHC